VEQRLERVLGEREAAQFVEGRLGGDVVVVGNHVLNSGRSHRTYTRRR
jgi:hypothetical protein